MARDRERDGAVVAVCVTVVLWASAFVGIRSAGRALDPGALALLRLLVGSAALGALMLIRRERLPPRRALGGIAVAGVLWFGAYNLLLNDAERKVDAGTAAMLVNVGPILLAILAGLVLREGFPRRLVAGCALAFVGVIVIGFATSHGGFEASWGALQCVVAALAYAIGVVGQKPALDHASPLQVTWLACTIGALVCLPAVGSLTQELGSAHATAIGWALYLGAGPTAVGFAAWAYALARTSAGRLGVTTYAVPPLTILLGWILLGETPAGLAYAGGAICLAGVAVARGLPGRGAPRAWVRRRARA
jgi:drug/metabolite transporter (DMT)-like permease